MALIFAYTHDHKARSDDELTIHAKSRSPTLLDHLVGATEKRQRNAQPNRADTIVAQNLTFWEAFESVAVALCRRRVSTNEWPI